MQTICKLIPDTEGSRSLESLASLGILNREDHEGEGINWFRPAQNECKPGLKAVDLERIEAIDP